MARVFSKRLWAVLGLTAQINQAPPPGTRWVVRDVEVYCNAPLGGARFTMMGEIGQAILTFVFSPNTTSSQRVDCRIVVMEGTQLAIKADQPCDVTISGYELTLP